MDISLHSQAAENNSYRDVLGDSFDSTANSRVSFFILDNQLEDSWQCPDSFRNRPDLSDPRLALNFGLEGIDKIIGHAFLSYNNLL